MLWCLSHILLWQQITQIQLHRQKEGMGSLLEISKECRLQEEVILLILNVIYNCMLELKGYE